MKKILLSILCLFLIPFMVNATSTTFKGSSNILGYDAIIINEKGVNGIPYNTNVHVDDENNGYVDVCTMDKIDRCLEYAKKIPISDIKVLEEEPSIESFKSINNYGTTLIEYNSKLLIVRDEGIKLKKGPSEVYGEYEQDILNMTILNIKYAIKTENDYYTWYYIEENDYKGWINDSLNSPYSSNIFHYIDNNLMSFDELRFYDSKTNEVIATIPPGTEINEFYEGNLYQKMYLTYNGVFGYVSNLKNDYFYFPYGYKSEGNYLQTIENTNMMVNNETIGSISKGEKAKILYEDSNGRPVCLDEEKTDCYYYVEYNNYKGFVSSKTVELNNTTSNENIKNNGNGSNSLLYVIIGFISISLISAFIIFYVIYRKKQTSKINN